MKRLILLLFAISAPLALFAQYNATAVIAQPDELSAFRYLPGRLQMGDRLVAVSLGNPYVYFGQNIAGYGTLLDAFDADRGSADRSEDWRKLADKLKARNRVGAVVEAMPLAVAFRPGRESPLTFVLTTEVRAGVGASFNREFGELIMVGNKGMQGENIDLGDALSMRAIGIQTFGLGANYQLIGEPGDALHVAVGGQLKVVRGLVSADLEINRASLYSSEPELRFDYDYSMRTAGLDDRYDVSPTQSSGSGFGVDLGATVGLGDNIEISGSILNMGAVKFNKNITTYRGQDSFTWTGAESEQFLDLSRYNADSLIDRLRPQEEYGGSFRQNIGPMVILQAVYRLQDSDNEYDVHRLGLTYFQGLASGPLTSSRPFLAGSYLFHPVKALGLGASMGWGGHSGFALGLMLAVDTKFFRMGIGSQQLLGAISPTSGTATDINLTLDFAF